MQVLNSTGHIEGNGKPLFPFQWPQPGIRPFKQMQAQRTLGHIFVHHNFFPAVDTITEETHEVPVSNLGKHGDLCLELPQPHAVHLRGLHPLHGNFGAVVQLPSVYHPESASPQYVLVAEIVSSLLEHLDRYDHVAGWLDNMTVARATVAHISNHQRPLTLPQQIAVAQTRNECQSHNADNNSRYPSFAP